MCIYIYIYIHHDLYLSLYINIYTYVYLIFAKYNNYTTYARSPASARRCRLTAPLSTQASSQPAILP